jgi:BMFP domain-containing protein YqiC
LDLQFLRETAAESVKEYCTQTIPFEFTKTLAGIAVIIKESFQIYNNAINSRDKLAALELAMTALEKRTDLLANASMVQRISQDASDMKQELEELRRLQQWQARTQREEEMLEGEDVNNKGNRQFEKYNSRYKS